MPSLPRRVVFRLDRELSALFAPYQLRVWLARPRTLEACVDFAFGFRPFRPIWQVRPELELFLAEMYADEWASQPRLVLNLVPT